jgi:hypothetical protein
MHDFVNGIEYRLTLKTKNWQEAKKKEKETLAEIAEGKFGSQGKVARQTFNVAADTYIQERQLHSAEKTRCTDQERDTEAWRLSLRLCEIQSHGARPVRGEETRTERR